MFFLFTVYLYFNHAKTERSKEILEAMLIPALVVDCLLVILMIVVFAKK